MKDIIMGFKDCELVETQDRLVKYNGDFEQLLSESDDSRTLIYDIPRPEFNKILSKAEITNPHFHFDSDYMKFLQDGGDMPSGEYYVCGLFERKALKSYACVSLNSPKSNTYIECYQALESGFGKPLLIDLIRTYKKLWLFADITVGKKLYDYYSQECFRLTEVLFDDGVGLPTYHCFLTEGCDLDGIADLVKEEYAIRFCGFADKAHHLKVKRNKSAKLKEREAQEITERHQMSESNYINYLAHMLDEVFPVYNEFNENSILNPDCSVSHMSIGYTDDGEPYSIAF